jgi:hypothetical protein
MQPAHHTFALGLIHCAGVGEFVLDRESLGMIPDRFNLTSQSLEFVGHALLGDFLSTLRLPNETLEETDVFVALVIDLCPYLLSMIAHT